MNLSGNLQRLLKVKVWYLHANELTLSKSGGPAYSVIGKLEVLDDIEDQHFVFQFFIPENYALQVLSRPHSMYFDGQEHVWQHIKIFIRLDPAICWWWVSPDDRAQRNFIAQQLLWIDSKERTKVAVTQTKISLYQQEINITKQKRVRKWIVNESLYLSDISQSVDASGWIKLRNIHTCKS